MDDDGIYDKPDARAAYKRWAIEAVIGMIARTLMQTDFRVKRNGKFVKDDIFYKLNVKPNKNQSAAVFWNEVARRLIYDGECLIVKSRSDDLLVAEDFSRKEYAVMDDLFTGIYVKGMELNGVFKRSEVLYLEYGNDELSGLVDSLFCDYGELIGRMFEFQKLKGQVRATVNVGAQFGKGEGNIKKLQNFVSKTYAAIKNKSIAIVPQQEGLEYREHTQQNISGQGVEEINKVTNGFLDKVCQAVGIPPSLLKGEVADIENVMRNYMRFCIDPIVKIIKDEANMQFISKRDYLKGDRVQVKRMSYRDIFDIAAGAEKLRGIAAIDGHEMRDELGMEHSDDPIHDKFFMTKNFQDSDSIEGGDEG